MSILPALLFLAANVQGATEPSRPGGDPAVLTQPSGPGLWIGGIAFGGEDIATAEQSWDGSTGTPTVVLTFTDSGRDRFLRAQEGRLYQPIEIAVDGELISSPHLAERIEGRQVMISGAFTVEDAKALARRLRGLRPTR